MESVTDIFLRFYCLGEMVLENERSGNKKIEVQCRSFLNDIERLRKHCEKQNEKITQLNSTIDELQEQYEMVSFELKEANDKMKRKSKLQRNYQNTEETCEICKKTANELNQTIRDNLKIKQYHKERETQLINHIEFLNRENGELKQNLASCLQILNDDETNKSMEELLDLKNKELAELKETFTEIIRKEFEESEDDKKQIALLKEKCDDLHLQVQNQRESEMKLKFENELLKLSVKTEIDKSQNLSLQNDELNWKLNHEREILAKNISESTDSESEKSINTELNNSNTYLGASSQIYSNNTPSASLNTCNAAELDEHSSMKEVPLIVQIDFPVQKRNSISYFLRIVEDTDEISAALEQINSRNFPGERDILTVNEEAYRQIAYSIESGQKFFIGNNSRCV